MPKEAQRRDYTGLNKIAVFRSFAEEATKNSHNTIKAVWTILFTGGTFALLHSFDEWLRSFEKIVFAFSADKGFVQWAELHGEELFISLLKLSLFLVYLLTFYRFYVGNIRVFDMKYDEVFKFVDNLHKTNNWKGKKEIEKEIAKNSDYRSLLDYSTSLSGHEIFILMLGTLIIVYLTVLPLHPIKFLFFYWILLVVDLLWMLFGESEHFFERYFFDEVFAGEFPNPRAPNLPRFPRYATRRWNRNNRVFAVAIGVVLTIYISIDYICTSPVALDLGKNGLLGLAALLALANCIIDLVLTWDFYNPKFRVSYEVVARNQRHS
jgi:hypothetical protein